MTWFATVIMLLCVQSANAFTLTCLRGSGFSEDEGCQNLFDGTQNTKWGTWDGWYENPVYAIFKAQFPIAAASYELVIANDTPGSPGRNWKKWSIFGANFASDADATIDAEGWVLIDQKDENLPTGEENNSFLVVPLTLSNPQSTFYSYYKIVVEELAGGWGNYCQMDEFRFVDFKVDTSVAKDYVDFDYTTNVEADLQAIYTEKLAELQAAVTAGDADKIVAIMEALDSICDEINTLRNGGFIALDWTAAWGDGPGSNLIDKNDNTIPYTVSAALFL